MIVERNYDLAPHNSYRIHAVASCVLFPESPTELESIFANSNHETTHLLGRGYNIILSKARYENETFVILGDHYDGIQMFEERELEVLAGTDMRALARFAADHGLSGLEVFCDIPSSVGGAVFMNASAAGRGLDGVLAGVRALMLSDLKWRTLQHQELQVGYRTSLFHTRPGVISSARFILNPGNRTEILEAMNSIQIQRHRRQPTDLPNAGSVFMRPPGCYVGAIIEELGLKGFAIGDAMVSTKHGGFIVNKGRATGQQILALVGYIQERVQATHGIKLELEQRVI